MNYRPEIDGLRAVAVVPVILFHAGFEAMGGGYVGVDVFYVISGYLITGILLKDWSEGRFSIRNFYERRARRILPALFCVTFFTLPFAYVLLQPADMMEFAKSLVAMATFSSNIFFWMQSGYFDTAAEMKPMLHTWSLAVEEQYYVLFPILLLWLVRFGRGVRLAVIGFAAAASFVAALVTIGIAPSAAFFLLPFRAWEILLGSLCAIFMQERQWPAPGITASSRASHQLLAAAGLIAILAACVLFTEATPSPSQYTLLPTVGTALIVLFAGPTTIVGRLLASPPLVGIGLLSYSAYLWHQPILALARHRSLAELTPAQQIILPLAAFFLAFLTYRYVETPWRKPGSFRRSTLLVSALACSAVIMASGTAGIVTDGLPSRFTKQELKANKTVRRLQKQRYTTIRIGKCQFNERKADVKVEKFLAKWNCIDDPAMPHLVRIPVAVVGDSHGADVVMSIKLNGYAPLQMTGAGCSLVPHLMTPECQKLFAWLKERIGGDSAYRYIALVNLFRPEELTPEALASMVRYWKGFGKELVFFTARPEFQNYQRRLMRGLDPVADVEKAKEAATAPIVDALRAEGVHVVDGLALFCSIADGCGYRSEDGSLLMADDNHLSREGATRFGRALFATDKLFAGIASSITGASSQVAPAP